MATPAYGNLKAMAISSKRLGWSPSTLITLAFGLSVLLKIAVTVGLRRAAGYPEARKEYSYIGHDYPQEWPIDRPSVLLPFSHTTRFELDSPDGIAEWDANVPGNGVVYLGEHKQPFTVALMHQLRCLDILRENIVRDDATEGPSELARHCLNYMKQSIICRGDTHLEPMQYPNHHDPIDKEGIYECKDWGAVYHAVKRTQDEYARYSSEISGQ